MASDTTEIIRLTGGTVKAHVSVQERIETGQTPVLFRRQEATAKLFWEFFAVTIPNKNTMRAYLIACFHFSDWCQNGLEEPLALVDVEPMHVALYVRVLSDHYMPATVKQHLAAIRMLLDYLVINQALAMNPARSVKGPKNVVKRGKTPVLNEEETRMLFAAIDTSKLIGLRDRAFISVMLFSFARVTAVTNMTLADYYTQGKRSFFRMTDKGSKYHQVPAHHKAVDWLDEYIEAAGIEGETDKPLFRSMIRKGKLYQLKDTGLSSRSSLKMVKRRALRAGLPSDICNHTFRGTGITNYLRNGGKIEVAAQIAGHESIETTQLYDHTDDDISLDEIERIVI